MYITKRFQCAALITAIICAAAVLFVFEPGPSGIYAPCLFNKITGLYCPGCGSMRGLHQLLHGHILTAMRLNPLTVLLLPFLMFALALYSVNATRTQALLRVLPPAFTWSLAAVIIIFGIVRNLPIYPFSMLAP